MLQPHRIEVFKEHLTALLVSLGSFYFVVRLYLFLKVIFVISQFIVKNLFKSIESVRRFRASQFDLVKAGLKAEGEVVSVNMEFLKAGTPSPAVC